jgi:hypothetical protein
MENEKIINVIVSEKAIAEELIKVLVEDGFEPNEVISSYDMENQHVIVNNLFSKRTFFAGVTAFFIILSLQYLMMTSYIEVLVGGKEYKSPFEHLIYFVPISFVGAIFLSSIYVFILFLRSSNLLSWNNDKLLSQLKGGEVLLKYNHYPELEIKLKSFILLHEGGVKISWGN